MLAEQVFIQYFCQKNSGKYNVMKTIRFLFLAGLVFMITMPGNMLHAQDAKPGHNADPDVKWKVTKEYDENGNLIYYDSSCVQSWRHFDFRGPCGGHVFEDLDSVFSDVFHFPHDVFKDHLVFGELMDSLDLNFYLDSSIFHGQMGFQPLIEFHDSSWTDSFFPDSLFPDAFMPFGEYFPFDEFPFNPRSFHGPDGFFDSHKEWLDKFQEEFNFPDDSTNQHHPKWQYMPGQQKKRPKGIEI